MTALPHVPSLRLGTHCSPARDLDVMFKLRHHLGILEKGYWSAESTVDIFDVDEVGSKLYAGVHGEEARRLIEVDCDAKKNRTHPRIRLIFVDGVQKTPDKLHVTSELTKFMFDSYDISPRFSGFLTKQELPGRTLHFERGTNKPLRYELWWSAVIRSFYNHGNEAPDLTRRVLDWMLMNVWSDLDLETGDQTCLIWRCPRKMKEAFFSNFEGEDGLGLQQHPMILHAFFLESILAHTYFFLDEFAQPLYGQEFTTREDLITAEDYTARSQKFLEISRQIRQVATDYDILEDTVEHLQKAHLWFEGATILDAPSLASRPRRSSSEGINGRRRSSNALPWSPLRSFATLVEGESEEAIAPSRSVGVIQCLADNFERYRKEVNLFRTYSGLYVQRSKLGVNECFAMVNQRDAELNIRMAAESTDIARRSHQDSRSLRIIQIMSMVFLPASLISSIFGMGFFSTSLVEGGGTQFAISDNWWWYIAVSFPLTAVTLAYMGLHNILRKRREQMASTRADDVERFSFKEKEG